MTLPQFARYINPLLSALGRLGGSARPREVVDAIVNDLRLPDEVLDDRLADGVPRFENQVHWARLYLAETGYLDRSRRGVWTLTEKASLVGQLSDAEIRALIREVQERRRRAEGGETPHSTKEEPDEGPPPSEESIGNYRDELLQTLKILPAAGFERLCQRLLRESGFERVTVTGRSGDGGIDGHGVVLVNTFVSFRVLFQCKRYTGSVGPSEVRDFRGAMSGRADKGIILTTGSFTAEAKREATRDGPTPIELVDGERLLALFEELELGLKPRRTFDLDERFFDEFR